MDDRNDYGNVHNMDDGNILDDMLQDDMDNGRNHIHVHKLGNNDENMEAFINQSFLSFSLQYNGM